MSGWRIARETPAPSCIASSTRWPRKYPQIGCVAGKGLVAGLACVRPGTTEPDGDLAFDVVRRAMHKGVLMFAPVGFGGATVKISPPLVIPEDAMVESVDALDEAFAEAVSQAASA